jgi:3-hydroxybutyryl-CoA dehydratase
MDNQVSLMPRKGLVFEEFAVGQAVVSQARTVTETDLVGFAALSGDWSSIHSDAVYAAQTPYGQRVVHGLLGLSMAVGLAVRLGFLEDTLLAFREIRDWKFSRPIFIGDTLRVRITVRETKVVRRMGGGLVTFEAEIVNQSDEIVQHGTWLVLMKGRDGDGPAG